MPDIEFECPDDLYELCCQQAAKEGVTFNEWCRRAIVESVASVKCVRCGKHKQSKYGLCLLCRFIGFPLELLWGKLRIIAGNMLGRMSGYKKGYDVGYQTGTNILEPMTYEKFTVACDRTWSGTPDSMGEDQELSFLAIAINGEAGEFAEHVKKLYRDDNGVLTPERRKLILKELGDIHYYSDRAAQFLDSSMGEVAQMNVDKLKDRVRRGVKGGSGDNR